MLRRFSTRQLWIINLSLFSVAILCVLIPFLWISPFRPQTATRLNAGYFLREYGHYFTTLDALLSILISATLIRRHRFLGKTFALVCCAFTILIAWFSHQNYFEWFFRPVERPGYASVGTVNFLKNSDLVLGIEINGDAVAYPVRYLAYHHLVNDVVGGKPVVATY